MQEKWDQQAGSIFFWKWGGQTYPKSSPPPPKKKTLQKFQSVWTSIFLSFTACSQKMEEASSKIQMWMKAGWGDATWVVRIRNNSKLKKNTGIAQIHDLTCNLFMSTCYFFYLLTCKIITRMPKVCNFFLFPYTFHWKQDLI